MRLSDMVPDRRGLFSERAADGEAPRARVAGLADDEAGQGLGEGRGESGDEGSIFLAGEDRLVDMGEYGKENGRRRGRARPGTIRHGKEERPKPSVAPLRKSREFRQGIPRARRIGFR